MFYIFDKDNFVNKTLINTVLLVGVIIMTFTFSSFNDRDPNKDSSDYYRGHYIEDDVSDNEYEVDEQSDQSDHPDWDSSDDDQVLIYDYMSDSDAHSG